MYKVEKLLLAMLLALFIGLAGAQEGAPADPAGEPAAPADPVAPEGDLGEPVADVPDVAWVRFAHLSPNAPELSVTLSPTSEEAAFPGENFDSVGYLEVTDYVELPSGNYLVSTRGSAASIEEEVSFARGAYYTLTVMGMVLPPEAETAAEDEDQEGFFAFFQNLFGNGDADRDRLALQFSLLEDDLTRVPAEGETLVRLVHAAPGTESVDLAVTGEDTTVIGGVEFAAASGYVNFDGAVDDLEVRVAGSQAATLDVSSLDLQPGNINTIFVVGTPVEEAPLSVLGSSIAPVEAGMAAGEDLALESPTDETADGSVGEEGAEDEEDNSADDATEGDGDEGGDAETDETEGN